MSEQAMVEHGQASQVQDLTIPADQAPQPKTVPATQGDRTGMQKEQKAEAQNATGKEQPAPKRQEYSRPSFKQKFTVNSLQAQRVMDRSFSRVAYAAFSLDVILRIIGDQDEVDQVESIINTQFKQVSEELSAVITQLKKVMADNGIEAVPGYSAPSEYTIEITSPLVAQFARLIRDLDELMSVVDTLWLNSVLNGHQRSQANFEWQQRLIKFAGRIIGMEKRARISAHTKGKEKEVLEAAPEQATQDPELDSASAEQDDENEKKDDKKTKVA